MITYLFNYLLNHFITSELENGVQTGAEITRTELLYKHLNKNSKKALRRLLKGSRLEARQ